MKIDYLFWDVVILLLGAAALYAVRSSGQPRKGIVWLYGATIGVVAFLPSEISFGPDAGMVGWSAALMTTMIADPIHLVVDLTSPLWGYLVHDFGLLGLWLVVVVTACLYHGPLALWLGRVYRRQPGRALALVAAILVFHLGLHLLMQEQVIGRRSVGRLRIGDNGPTLVRIVPAAPRPVQGALWPAGQLEAPGSSRYLGLLAASCNRPATLEVS